MLIHPKAILAVSRAAATEASRYALNVIHVQRMADGVQLTATNGKYLLRSTTPEADAEELPAGAIGRYPAIGPEALFEGKLEPGADSTRQIRGSPPSVCVASDTLKIFPVSRSPVSHAPNALTDCEPRHRSIR